MCRNASTSLQTQWNLANLEPFCPRSTSENKINRTLPSFTGTRKRNFTSSVLTLAQKNSAKGRWKFWNSFYWSDYEGTVPQGQPAVPTAQTQHSWWTKYWSSLQIMVATCDPTVLWRNLHGHVQFLRKVSNPRIPWSEHSSSGYTRNQFMPRTASHASNYQSSPYI